MKKYSKTIFELQKESFMREHGKTPYDPQKESFMRKYGKTPYDLKKEYAINKGYATPYKMKKAVDMKKLNQNNAQIPQEAGQITPSQQSNYSTLQHQPRPQTSSQRYLSRVPRFNDNRSQNTDHIQHLVGKKRQANQR